MIEYIYLVLNIFLILLAIATLFKPIIFLAGLSIGAIMILPLSYEGLSPFMINLTIIAIFLNVCFFIIGVVRKRGM